MQSGQYLGSFSARCAATRNTATRDARHETDAGAASCISLSRPDMRQTIPDPPNLPYPTRRCEERERAPRSSTCTLLVDVEAAGPVTGVTGEVVQLRSAVEEVVGDVLRCMMLTGLPPATGSRSAACNRRTGREAQASGESISAWRPLVSMPITARRPRSCLPRRAHSHGPLRGPREAMA